MQIRRSLRDKYTFILSITVYLILFLNIIALYVVLSQNLLVGVQVPFYVIALPFAFIEFLPFKYEYYWVSFLVIVILISFALSSLDFYRYAKNEDGRFGKLTELIILTISVTYLTYYISLFVTSQQNPFGNPIGNTPPNYVILSFLHAPVYEELVYRVILLGIPAFIINYFYYGKKIPFYRAFTGGKFEMNKGTVTFLFISAFFFGSAHLISWEPAKFPSAFFAGLVLGYLFLRYGVYMSITMHFIIDFSGTYSYINGPTWYIITIISGIILLIWFVAGLPYYYIYLRSLIKHSQKENPKEVKMMDVQTIRQKNYVLGYEIKCPYCGFDKFEVIEGNKLRCLRCGGIFQIKK